MWLKSQVFWVIPEQVLLSGVPGQPPLSRWIAQMDRKFMLLDWAKLSGWDVRPFQSSVHELFPVDCRNASVKYLAPDDWAVAVMLGVFGAR
jgi:hypothetical protein